MSVSYFFSLFQRRFLFFCQVHVGWQPAVWELSRSGEAADLLVCGDQLLSCRWPLVRVFQGHGPHSLGPPHRCGSSQEGGPYPRSSWGSGPATPASAPRGLTCCPETGAAPVPTPRPARPMPQDPPEFWPTFKLTEFKKQVETAKGYYWIPSIQPTQC